MLGARRGEHVAHLVPEARPVGEREARQEAALADAEHRDLAAGEPELPAQPVDQVLDGDLDVGGREVGKLTQQAGWPKASSAGLPIAYAWSPVMPVPVTTMSGVRRASSIFPSQ
jgi:hypothetical protein